MNEKMKKRDSNFELLRIISMCMIFLLHYYLYADISTVNNYTFNKLISMVLSIGGRVGVNIFIIIMGYFLVNSKFKLKKLFKLIVETIFYALLFNAIAVIQLHEKFEIEGFKPLFTPIINKTYWFITYYFATYLISPIINKFIKSINQNSFKKVVLISGFILTVIPTVFRKVFVSDYYVWFIFLYLIGAYIRLYGMNIEKGIKKYILTIGSFVIVIAMLIGSIIINKCFNKNIDVTYVYDTYTSLYSIFPLLSAIGLVLIFKNIKLKYNPIINFLGRGSLAFYCIHDHCNYKSLFWNLDLKSYLYTNKNAMVFIFSVFLSMTVAYIVCAVIENLRILIIENNLFKIKVFDKYIDKFDNWYNSIAED